MPQAVTHILVPLVIIALIRDYYLRKRDKRHFPLHYVLIAGLAGTLPDFDVAAYWILQHFGFTFAEVHRTITHSIFFSLFFLLLYFVFSIEKIRIPTLGRHKLKLNIIFLMIAFGCFTHIVLDGLLSGVIFLFYPFSHYAFGLYLVKYLPEQLQTLFFPTLDAALLIIWLIYLELKHKISDFI